MTSPHPEPPPLHQLDGYHAMTLQQITAWVEQVYPTVVVENKDRARQWFDVAVNLFELTVNEPNLEESISRLAELAAELLLAHAEHQIGRKLL